MTLHLLTSLHGFLLETVTDFSSNEADGLIQSFQRESSGWQARMELLKLPEQKLGRSLRRLDQLWRRPKAKNKSSINCSADNSSPILCT